MSNEKTAVMNKVVLSSDRWVGRADRLGSLRERFSRGLNNATPGSQMLRSSLNKA